MKVEQKLFDFSRKDRNGLKIWKRKWKSVKRKWKLKFFGGSGNGNGTAFSGGTDAEMKVSISD
jgi:hypothetical protein